jgi:quercetin dioxygenase-like cupin family protein
MTTATATPIVRNAGEGERRWFYGGGTHTWKVTPEESGGAFFLFEDEMTEGKVTPWHSHPDADEMAYVLEGEIEVRVAGRKQRVCAGGMSFTPRGVAHAFRVVSPTARILAWQTPGAGGAFFWNASEPATSDAEGPVDFERIGEWATKTGAVEILGPPPFRAE